MGKFADKFGRKYIYLLCVFLFGLGSLICGLSQNVGNFWVLIVGRAIQAIGGGGIMPVATAEFGTAFPEEKRGMALGLVGAVYGVANVFGSSAGSLIMDIFGHENWQFIFYVNIPICAFILIMGFLKLPNSREEDVKPIDWGGIVVLTLATLSLLIGLKNIDFFDIGNSIQSMDVWPYLLAFIILLPIFILIERKVTDPVMNINYFKNPSIVITLICSLAAGILMMATAFLPQFCENAARIASGSGGYFIIILGLFAGAGGPMSGKMIDKMGVKPVLGMGFGVAAAGCAYLSFIACPNPNMFNIVVSLILLGFGLGFTMGTPLNYMMLQKTDDKEANSALATLSLVRSIGTAVAPAIMVAFIAHAGANMQDNLMEVMPKEVEVSALPYAQELDQQIDDMKNTEEGAEMLEGLEIPKLMDYTKFEVEMDPDASDKDIKVSDSTIELMENSDITTITDTTKVMVNDIFGQLKPDLIKEAQDGIDAGIVAMEDGLAEMDEALSEMASGKNDLSSNISEMQSQISEMDSQIEQMQTAKAAQEAALAQMQAAGAPEPAQAELKASIAKLEAGISGIEQGKSQMSNAVSQMQNAQNEMGSGEQDLQASRDELADTIDKLKVVRDAIPAKFDEAQNNYLAEIDNRSDDIQTVFQMTLNEGFFGMFIFGGICSLIGLLLLLFYKDEEHRKKLKETQGDKDAPKELEPKNSDSSEQE
ncbi:MAG: MFS transporter, partial [Coriobacteriales bacterium]|nr:MFS transporter [Coriobacteriales bacterium]